MGYNPFKMKAGKDSGYDNSPMKKNYGQFGVGSSEMPTKPTPNKFGANMLGGGSIGKIIQELKDKKAAKQAEAAGTAGGEAAGGGEPQTLMDQQAGGMEGGEESMDAGGGEVPQHGPEAHSGGNGVNVKKQRGGIFKGLMGSKKPGNRGFLGGIFG